MSLLCCSSSLALALVACPNASPGSVWLFCSQQSVSKPLFSPFPVFLSLCCSLQCLSYHFTRVASVIARFRTCEGLFTAVRSFSADTEEELTPPFFGLPVSSQHRRLRTTATLWALGSSDPPRLLL